ncbi:unnamed protein product [Dovyalis caffra]|uniref:B-like cyclin n=1 Tax=Dovyalis caffra TaxID=77055 RepID=A0AAV1SAS2_9ROSI|nr:unnamed protein product [Dovyalis caffra]
MAPSFDCAVSNLLCAEDNNSILDDNDYCDATVEEFEATWHHGHNRIQNQNGGGDGGGCQCRECQHLPNGDYLKRLRNGDLDLGARKEAVDWIAKVHAHFGFGPLCACLSINYLDRFLSAYDLPKGNAWMMQLLAVACLSLAAKMEETEVPLSLDLQDPDIIGIYFLEFRPSEIAVAVAIAVVGETKTVDAEQAISVLTQPVQKERVLKCFQLIHDLSLLGGPAKDTSTSLLSVPQSPIGVLDAACLSYSSDHTTVGPCANSSRNAPDAKRRKLDKPCEV